MSDGQLTLDAAAALVAAMDTPAPEATPAKAATPAAEPAAPDTAAAAPEGDEGTGGNHEDLPETGADSAAAAPEEGEEDGEQDGAPVPAVEAPRWWDAEDKAAFASLTPEQQALVVKQESKREEVFRKEKTATVEARKTALTLAQEARAALDALQVHLPDPVKAFHDKYADVDQIDFDRWVQQDPLKANQYIAQYQADRMALERTLAAKQNAERVSQETFAREQMARLQEIAPDLAKPEALRALGDFLPQTGIPVEALHNASAEELVILNESRLYRAMMAKAASPATANGAPQKQQPPAKVPPQGQAKPQGNSKTREADRLRHRLAQTGDVDTAAALITLSGY